MKRLVFRILALAVVVSVSWIAYAYAQHVNDSRDPEQTPAARPTADQGQLQPAPTIITPALEPNPLRGTQGQEPAPASSLSYYPTAPNTGEQAAYPTPGAATATEGGASGAPADAFGSPAATNQRPVAEPRAADSVYASPTNAYTPANTYPPAGSRQRSYEAEPDPSSAMLSQHLRAEPSNGSTRDYQRPEASSAQNTNWPNEATTTPYAGAGNSTAPKQFQGEPSGAPLAGYQGAATSADRYPAAPTGRASNAGDYDRAYDNSNPSGFSAQARRVESAIIDEGTGRPANDRQLEGQQTPQLSVQKIAPTEIQVGKPAVFRVEVKNTGSVTARDVEIRDQIPEGTRLIRTKPDFTSRSRDELVWKLNNIEPNGGASVEMEVEPITEGEIGSVATVHFGASASMRTRATKPELTLNVNSPKTVMIEGQATLSITISNPGSGIARDVVLEEHVPKCLQHPAGAQLEYEVGDLAPNESKTLELVLTAHHPGQAVNLLIARADAVPEVKKELPIEVVAPKLQVALSGSKKRYLERQATYEVAVSNPGTAPAREVRLQAALPRGLKFVSADKNAHYDPQTRTVHWALAQLPAGETGTVQLTTLPVEIGRHTLQIRSTADKALAVKEEEQIAVDGIAAIRFEVRDVKDPIEVGGESVYEIRVLNQGSKEATQVALAAELSPGLDFVSAEGPDSLRSHQPRAGQIVFEPLPRLSPKADVTYRVHVRGTQPGDKRIRVQLMAAELQRPVIKEESTNVFSDR